MIKEKAVLDNLVKKVYDFSEVSSASKEDKKRIAKKVMCRLYYDIRTFGAVIATSEKQDQVRGPIQMTFARSYDPITTAEHSSHRMAVTKEADLEKERTMGRKSTIPYGLYGCHGFVSANLAAQTGFSEDDLVLFWEALKNMFDVDRSAARGLMSAQKLIVFKHDSALGNAPANQLFDLVHVEKKADVDVPRKFGDYVVSIEKEKIPSGVSLEELI